MPRLLLPLALTALVLAASWAMTPAPPLSIVGTWEVRPALAPSEDPKASDAAFLVLRSAHPDWVTDRTTYHADGTGQAELVHFDHTETDPIFFWELVKARSMRITITTRDSLNGWEQSVDYLVNSPDSLTIESGKMHRLRLIRVP